MNSIQGKGKRRKASQNKTANKPQQKSKSLGRQVLESLGGTAGSLIGLKDLGRDAGAWISKVTGLGEYKVNSNVFAKSSEDVPVFEYSKDGSIIITHREMVNDVVGSIAFASSYYDVHPLNPVLFPWLSIEALGYEQYEFLGLLACYNSTSGDAVSSTNNALGTVIISTEYDVSRPPFSTKAEMESYMFTSAKKPSVSFIHPIECNPKVDILNARYNNGYFRTQSASTVASPTSFTSNVAENLNCLGRIQVSTVGMQAATTVGELWVTYRVKLSKARAPPPGLTGGVFHAGSSNLGAIQSGSTTFASPAVYADSTYQTDTIGIDTNRVRFSGLRPGTRIFLKYLAVSTAGSSPTFASGGITPVGMNAVAVIFAGASYFEAGSGTNSYIQLCTYTIGENPSLTPPTLTWANPTITGSGATFKWEMFIDLEPQYYGSGTVPTLMSLQDKMSIYDELVSLNRLKLNRNDSDEKDSVVVSSSYIT
jgi:hypothetical protein